MPVERRGDLVKINRPEGTYNIIYSMHDRAQSPDQIPNSLGGLVLETNARWTDDPLLYLVAYKNYLLYRNIFYALEMHRVPVIFADPDFTYAQNMSLDQNLHHGINVTPRVLEGMIGGVVLTKCLQQRQSRNTFLRMGLGILGLYELLPMVALSANVTAHDLNTAQGKAIEFSKASQRIHPEWSISPIGIRNTVYAEKEEWLLQSGLLGDTKSIGNIIGAEHGGLENQIESSSKDRLSFLRKTKPIWSRFIDDTFSDIAIFRFNGQQWQLAKHVVVPQLRSLLENI